MPQRKTSGPAAGDDTLPGVAAESQGPQSVDSSGHANDTARVVLTRVFRPTRVTCRRPHCPPDVASANRPKLQMKNKH